MNINLNPNSELNQSIVNVPDVVQVPDVWINEARQFRMAMMMYACAIREVKTKLEVLNDELSIKNQRNPIEMIKSRVNALVFGMVYNFLPFMIYPIYNTLQKMDRSLIEAAQDLGANPLQVFGKVILPLSMPGIMSGIVMVFMPTVSTFAIAELLTMNNIKLFGTTVQENIYNGMWNYGAALSLIMLLLIGVTILFTNEEDGASNESGGVI